MGSHESAFLRRACPRFHRTARQRAVRGRLGDESSFPYELQGLFARDRDEQFAESPRPAGALGLDGGEVSPGPAMSSRTEIPGRVSRDAETALHSFCTCRMGIDRLAVVDPDTMWVHGTQGLRIVDASVMALVTSANIYVPIMMIAERVSDLIQARRTLWPRGADPCRLQRRVARGFERRSRSPGRGAFRPLWCSLKADARPQSSGMKAAESRAACSASTASSARCFPCVPNASP